MNVYAIKIDTSLNDINSFMPLLSEERIKKINKYIYENARKISILSEILVKYMLYKEYRFSPHFIIFEYNEFGKPFLKNCKDIFFNISHSVTPLIQPPLISFYPKVGFLCWFSMFSNVRFLLYHKRKSS